LGCIDVHVIRTHTTAKTTCFAEITLGQYKNEILSVIRKFSFSSIVAKIMEISIPHHCMHIYAYLPIWLTQK